MTSIFRTSFFKLTILTLLAVSAWSGGSLYAWELNSGNIADPAYGNCAPSATSCSLNSKSITSIAPDTFVGYSSLQTFQLYNNQITSIESGAFAGLSSLTYLYLRNNQITSIESGAFAGLSSLTSLQLYNNQITSIESGDFLGLSSLTQLSLYNNQITSIESGDFLGLSSLTQLSLYNNQITSIESGDFLGLSSLTQLSLYNNQITSIENGGFDGLSSLTYLSLGSNQITSIESGDFAGLSSLTNLYLRNNHITSIENGGFDGLSSLTSLQLYNNQITSIENGDFAGLSSLTDLQLYNNQITSIESGAFTGLSSLTSLQLDRNQIESIESGDFAGLSSLTQLSLRNNQITSIESGAFAGLSSLTQLSLRNNQITSIESGAFAGLSSLTYLTLNNNYITSIESGDFTGLSSLQVLYLGSNQITSIENGAFVGLSSLTQLSLRNNQITSIESGAFVGLSSLTELELYNNCLNTEDSFVTDYLDGLGLSYIDYTDQYVCLGVDYSPSSATTGSVTGSLMFYGPTSMVTQLSGENPNLSSYDYVFMENGTHAFDYSAVTDTNNYLGTRNNGYPDIVTGTVSWIVPDTIAPVSPIVSSPISGTTISGAVSASDSIAFTGTAEPLSIITITISGSVTTGTTDANGEFSIDVSGPFDFGTYQANITATDQAGNTSVMSTTTLHIIDPTPIVTTPVVVNTPSYGGGGGGGGATLIKDICPAGDNSPSYYDGSCGISKMSNIKTTETDKQPSDTIQAGVHHAATSTTIRSTTPSNFKISRASVEGEPIAFTDEAIFNDNITPDYCYTRKSDIIIKDTTTLSTSEEFKKAMAFMYAYDITMYDEIIDFQPNSALTRAEAAKVFVNFAEKVLCRVPDTSLNIDYKDIESANTSLKPYILEAYQLGLMKGSPDGNFNPSADITKVEFNAILVRMILKSYLPEDTSDLRYAEYNNVSEQLGIMTQGAGQESVARKNIANMLFRAYKYQTYSLQNIGYTSFVLKDRTDFVKQSPTIH